MQLKIYRSHGKSYLCDVIVGGDADLWISRQDEHPYNGYIFKTFSVCTLYCVRVAQTIFQKTCTEPTITSSTPMDGLKKKSKNVSKFLIVKLV